MRASAARRPWRSRRMAGCSSRRSSARCGSSRTGRSCRARRSISDGGPCTDNERGLLGAAVDPSFASNGFVYLYYTRNKSGTCVNRVSRFTMSGSTIAPATESVLVDEIPTPSGNHNGGDLRFGKDGYLYVSVGDGACDYAGRRLLRAERRLARPARADREDPADHQHRRHPADQPVPGRRHGSLQRHGPDDGREQVPGDLRVGPPEPVPDRVRPEHDRDALLRQRRRRGNLGGGRRGRRPAPTTAGTCARGPAPTARRRTAARRPAGMTNPVYAYSHDESELPRDHRRRLRPERHLAARRTTARTSTATTPAARSSCSPRTGAVASRGASSPTTSARSST